MSHPDWQFGEHPDMYALRAYGHAGESAQFQSHLTFIIAHVGSTENLGFVDSCLDKYPNMYIDIADASMNWADSPIQAGSSFPVGQDRILFGSDAFPGIWKGVIPIFPLPDDLGRIFRLRRKMGPLWIRPGDDITGRYTIRMRKRCSCWKAEGSRPADTVFTQPALRIGNNYRYFVPAKVFRPVRCILMLHSAQWSCSSDSCYTSGPPDNRLNIQLFFRQSGFGRWFALNHDIQYRSPEMLPFPLGFK